MRAIWLWILALGQAGCATSLQQDIVKPEVVMEYELSIFRWDAHQILVAKGVNDARLAELPSLAERRRLLREIGGNEVQIGARCAIQDGKFGVCNRFIVSPNSATSRRQAWAFLNQLRISPDSLKRSGVPANQAYIEMRIAVRGTQREFGEECILVPFCGVPTPPPPPLPRVPR